MWTVSNRASAETGTHPQPICAIGHSARGSWRDGLPLSLIRKGLWLHTHTHTKTHTRTAEGREEQSLFYIYTSNSTTKTILGFARLIV